MSVKWWNALEFNISGKRAHPKINKQPSFNTCTLNVFCTQYSTNLIVLDINNNIFEVLTDFSFFLPFLLKVDSDSLDEWVLAVHLTCLFPCLTPTHAPKFTNNPPSPQFTDTPLPPSRPPAHNSRPSPDSLHQCQLNIHSSFHQTDHV